MDRHRKGNPRRVKSHPNCINLQGRTFGKLSVLRRSKDHVCPCGRALVMWECLCACGKKKAIRASSLTAPSEATVSCGCDRKARNYTRNGASFHELWNTYQGMLDRCYTPSAAGYYLYGGRGITVCKRWRNSFDAFLADMGPRPRGLTLDRKNSNGNYTPINCQWADRDTQILSRRNTYRVNLNGTVTWLSKAMRSIGLNPQRAFGRMRRHGWSAQRALNFHLETTA